MSEGIQGVRPGLVLLPGSVPEAAATARRAEAAGFAGVHSGEFIDRSATVTLAAMAAATSTVALGSAIAYAVGRSPLVLANDARGLDELSDGRLVLGLGTGTRRMMRDWHGVTDPDAPALLLEELIGLLRRLWRLHEGPVRHEGRFFRLDIRPTAAVAPPRRPSIPIFTAGVNARMVEVAGRVADGLIAHPVATQGYLDEVVAPALARGADRAGRRARDVVVAGVVLCAVADDVEQARREVAAQIAFYSVPKTYQAALEVGGFGRQAAAARDAFGRTDHAGMAAAVSDDMIDALALAGTADDVRRGFARFAARFDRVLLSPASFMSSPQRVRDNVAAVVDAFAPAR